MLMRWIRRYYLRTFIFVICLYSLPMGVARGSSLEVPVDLGVGPAAYMINNPIFLDQPVHFGMKISVAAIINRALLRRYRNRVPSRYRSMLSRMRELRYNPLFFIPDSLVISPKINNTQMYGITFRPFAIGLSLMSSPVRISLGAGLLLSYVFIESDKLANKPMVMHFLRPGIDIVLDIEIPITRSFLISFGWASQVYVPQGVNSQIFAIPEAFEDWVWHFGQAYFLLHFRFPYKVNM